MTPRAALLLQCVMMTSPSWILRAPMRAISSTALSDLSQKAFALAETSALASSREDASDAPFTVACSPFHSETAVGLDARIVSLAPFRSARNPSRVPPVYVSAKSPSADAPALAILPAPRILMLRISSAVSSRGHDGGISDYPYKGAQWSRVEDAGMRCIRWSFTNMFILSVSDK